MKRNQLTTAFAALAMTVMIQALPALAAETVSDDPVPIPSTAHVAVETTNNMLKAWAPLVVRTESRRIAVKHVQFAATSALVDQAVYDYVRSYFRDIPALIEVARCESSFRQFDDNGNVMRGKAVAADVGVMQINEIYHLEASRNLGIDIYTLKGNTEYARYLYEHQGLRPWGASSKCWGQ